MNRTPCTDMAPLEAILGRYPRQEASLIQVLQDVNRTYRYLPCDVLRQVAEALGVPLAKVFSVSTFYRAFSLTPQGEPLLPVCTGTACHIRGSGQLVEEIGRRLSVKPGETTKDMAFTLKTVACVGACAMAPVFIVNGKYHGNAKPAQVAQAIGQKGGGHAH